MLDLLMLLLLGLAFAGAVGYVWGCVDLTSPTSGSPDQAP